MCSDQISFILTWSVPDVPWYDATKSCRSGRSCSSRPRLAKARGESASSEDAHVTLGQHSSLQSRKDVVLVLFSFLFVLWGLCLNRLNRFHFKIGRWTPSLGYESGAIMAGRSGKGGKAGRERLSCVTPAATDMPHDRNARGFGGRAPRCVCLLQCEVVKGFWPIFLFSTLLMTCDKKMHLHYLRLRNSLTCRFSWWLEFEPCFLVIFEGHPKGMSGLHGGRSHGGMWVSGAIWPRRKVSSGEGCSVGN